MMDFYESQDWQRYKEKGQHKIQGKAPKEPKERKTVGQKGAETIAKKGPKKALRIFKREERKERAKPARKKGKFLAAAKGAFKDARKKTPSSGRKKTGGRKYVKRNRKRSKKAFGLSLGGYNF